MPERKEADFLHAGELAVDRSNRKARAGISLFPIRIRRKSGSGYRYFWPMPSTSPLWRIGLGLIGGAVSLPLAGMASIVLYRPA
jgi:hypothetical protein